MSVEARPPIDPDLLRALEDLAEPVQRLRRVEEDITHLGDAMNYQRLGHARHERGDLLDRISIRAEALKLRPRALRLFVEEYTRIRARDRRRPSLAQLEREVIVAREALKRKRVEADAEQVLATVNARVAASFCNAADDAVLYLENCR